MARSSWLNKQTEKQRIIWGYKILLLDVLFPLAVDRIIFVDADQIVRSERGFVPHHGRMPTANAEDLCRCESTWRSVSPF